MGQHWMAKFGHLNNYYSIKEAAETYFRSDTSRISDKTCGYKDFQRWQYFMNARVDGNGTLGTYSQAFNTERSRLLADNVGEGIFARWQSAGPDNNNYNFNNAAMANLGLITSIWVDTSNFSTIYAGSNSSGLLVTRDGGNNWISLTDRYMVPGVDAIAKNPAQPNIIYIGTGFFTWGKDYGVGVLKSTNKGQTWDSTGLNENAFKDDPFFNNIGYRIGGLAQHPSIPDILIALVVFEYDKGAKIMRTTNGGVTWDEVYQIRSTGPNQLFKIDFHPLNPSMVMVSGAHVLQSNDAGITWVSLNDKFINPATHRISRASVSMHPNDISKILVLTANIQADTIPYPNENKLMYSSNGGQTYTEVTVLDSLFSLYKVGYYKMELEWSKVDENVFYIGGLFVSKHTLLNSTQATKDIIDGNPHVDVRELKTYKKHITGNTYEGWVFQGNDGGITKGLEHDDTLTWTDISKNGLNITQYYGIGIPNDDSELIIGGTQDGNFCHLQNDIYSLPFKGDAAEVVFDHENPNNVYMVTFMTPFYGLKSTDKGSTWGYLSADTINQIKIPDLVRRNDAPIEMSATNAKRIYIGGSEVWKTTNGFTTDPVKISNFKGTYDVELKLKVIREAKSNSNIIYAAREGAHWNHATIDRRRLFKTTDGGANWINIFVDSDPVPIVSSGISDLVVNPSNPNQIYLSMDRCNSGRSVFKGTGVSTITWESISEGLPDLPVNCLEYYDRSDLNELFAGTDMGVYYRNDSLNRWIPFGTGMPPTVISDLEINYHTNELVAATFGRGIYKVDLCFNPLIMNHLYVNGTQTWGNKILTDHVTITAGSVLTITGTVQMPANKYIFVEAGAKLIVDGGTITNGCRHDFWGGIVVHGSPTQPQNPLYQGIVSIKNNATIENALIGIHSRNTSEPIFPSFEQEDFQTRSNSGGGIIMASRSTFKNNIVAVQFEKNNMPCISQFDLCNFVTDTKFFLGYIPYHFIKMSETGGIKILGCSFTSLLAPGAAKRGRGIYSNNANFVVDYRCATSITPCNDSVRSTFTGLEYGIYALGKKGMRAFYVSNADFVTNEKAIYANAVDNISVKNNYFEMARVFLLPQGLASGLYLDNCTGYVIEENEFRTIGNPGNLTSYGIYINNSGEANNMIYRNRFFNTTYGITSHDKNRNIDGSAGLLLKCNQFGNIKTDIAVLKSNPNSVLMGIAKAQGSNDPEDCKKPAGNLFSQLIVNDYWSIWNDCEAIDYYHHKATSNDFVRPSKITNTTRFETERDFVEATCCPPNVIGGGGTGIIDGTTSAYKSEAESTSQALLALIDEGNTMEKVMDVNSAAPAEALVVRDDLLQTSPYVSDTVLKTAINREELLNNAMLRDIMVANPHSAKSESLMQELDMRLVPMPEYMKDEILEGVFVLSAKELMEAKRDMSNRLYNYGFNRLLSASLTDTLATPVDTVMALLGADGSAVSLMNQAWLLLENGDTTAALNRMQSIGNEISLSENELVELGQQQAFMQWLVENDGINSLDTETLNNFMMYSSPVVSSSARGLMIANYLLEYYEPYLEPDLTKNMEVRKPKLKPVNQENAYLKVYPNPAKDFITIEFNTGNDNANGKIEIIEESGRTAHVRNLTRQFDQIILDTRYLKPGNYIIKIVLNGKPVCSTKFVISR